jgi:hypothetical protein
MRSSTKTPMIKTVIIRTFLIITMTKTSRRTVVVPVVDAEAEVPAGAVAVAPGAEAAVAADSIHRAVVVAEVVPVVDFILQVVAAIPAVAGEAVSTHRVAVVVTEAFILRVVVADT